MGSDLIKPKAYSYLRFSNLEQRLGDSYRRQSTMANEYAMKNGLELDQSLTFEDVGVSAWHSLNSTAGKLAEFQEAVVSGHVVQGSYLLVESLDRISRDRVLFALDLLNRIVMAGVVIVTLTDGQVYSLDRLRSDPMGLMYALITFMRANEESEMRSKRLRHAWAAKRAAAADRLYTRRAPAWLRFDEDSKTFVAIPERAAIIHRIFEYALLHKGKSSIASLLNQEGVPPWGRAGYWSRGYIWRILNNRAVLGTLTPHVLVHEDGHIRRRAQDHIENVWPAVISEELFTTVRNLYGKVEKTRKGVSFNTMMMNMLSGLAKCSICGEGMYRHGMKTRRSIPLLFSCRRVREQVDCGSRNLPYEDIEKTVLRELPGELEALARRLDDDPVQESIVAAERELIAITRRLNFLTDTLLLKKSRVILGRIHELECQAESVRSGLDSLRRVYTMRSGPVAQARIRHAIAQFPRSPTELPDRVEINKALRRVFERCVVSKAASTIEFHTIDGDRTVLFFGKTVSPS